MQPYFQINMRLNIATLLFSGFLFTLFNTTNLDAAESTFKTRILSHDPIIHPQDPFVNIFIAGGHDYGVRGSIFGLNSNGLVEKDDWVNIFSHVGHLSAYINSSINSFKPGGDTIDRDILVEAAQSMVPPRESAGGLLEVILNDAKVFDLQDVFRTDLWQNMTHVFHALENIPVAGVANDEIVNLGIFGGSGGFRLKMSNQIFSSNQSEELRELNSINNLCKDLTDFEISFDYYPQLFSIGGRNTITGCRSGATASAITNSPGWLIGFLGGNSTDPNALRVYFRPDYYSAARDVKSIQLGASAYKTFYRIRITVVAVSPTSPNVLVTVYVDGAAGNTLTVPRPTAIDAPLRIFASDKTDKAPEIDNLEIRDATGLVAQYLFETDNSSPVSIDDRVNIATDSSGNGNHLVPLNYISTFTYMPTTGVYPNFSNRMNESLVTDFILSRNESAKPIPELITNYGFSEVPDRFAYWSSQGFTHGSIQYYVGTQNQVMDTDLSNINLFMNTDLARNASNEGSIWNHIWWGNNKINNEIHSQVMTVKQQQTALSLAILDGNRWITVFTSMSDGTLGSKNNTIEEKAIINADIFYALAETASWFQSTSTTLEQSLAVDDLTSLGLTANQSLYSRARQNYQTNELWYAGFLPESDNSGEPRNVQIQLLTQIGTVKNLATGAVVNVTDGLFNYTLGTNAQPYYYMPDQDLDGIRDDLDNN